jgi:hypothetical protein
MSRDDRAQLNHRRRAAAMRIVALLLVALSLTACGRKGSPQPPTDEPTTYPHPYPHA